LNAFIISIETKNSKKVGKRLKKGIEVA
jgi:hypothetical protein